MPEYAMHRIIQIATLVVVIFFMPVLSRMYAAESIRIGVCLSLTGENSEWGKRTLAGVQLRQEEWNNSGAKPSVELVIRDDEADEDLAKKHVMDLVEKEGVVALVGPGRPQSLRAVRKYLRVKRIVAISPNATHPDIGKDDDWVFRLLFDDDFQAQAIARFAYETLSMRRAAAILNTHYSYPETVFASFKKWFERLGGKIVGVERFDWRYDPDSIFDFSSILRDISKEKPEMVLLPLLTPEVVEVMHASLNLDFNASFFGTHTWASRELMMAGGNALLNAYCVTGFNSKATTEEMRHFRAMYNESNVAYLDLESIFGYDTLSLILYGFRDGVSSDALRATLYNLRNYPLASGPITITREHGTLRPAYIYKAVKEKVGFKTECLDVMFPEGMEKVESK